MSAPAKTSEREICAAVRRLLESGGEAGLSMQAIAVEVGIRAPSLYKRFADRDDLLSAAARDALLELAELLVHPPEPRGTYDRLERMGHSYRKFAKKNPRTYQLIYSEAMAAREDLLGARHAAAEPLLALLGQALPKEDVLPAARMLAAYLHGFLSMELAKAFRFGGGVNEAFQFGLTKCIGCLLAEKGSAGEKIRERLGEIFGGG